MLWHCKYSIVRDIRKVTYAISILRNKMLTTQLNRMRVTLACVDCCLLHIVIINLEQFPNASRTHALLTHVLSCSSLKESGTLLPLDVNKDDNNAA